jgi:hypothetical protein
MKEKEPSQNEAALFSSPTSRDFLSVSDDCMIREEKKMIKTSLIGITMCALSFAACGFLGCDGSERSHHSNPNAQETGMYLSNELTISDSAFIFKGGFKVGDKRCGTWLGINRKGKIITQIDYDPCDYRLDDIRTGDMLVTYSTEFGSRMYAFYVRENHIDSIVFGCHPQFCTVVEGDSTYAEMSSGFKLPF